MKKHVMLIVLLVLISILPLIDQSIVKGLNLQVYAETYARALYTDGVTNSSGVCLYKAYSEARSKQYVDPPTFICYAIAQSSVRIWTWNGKPAGSFGTIRPLFSRERTSLYIGGGGEGSASAWFDLTGEFHLVIYGISVGQVGPAVKYGHLRILVKDETGTLYDVAINWGTDGSGSHYYYATENVGKWPHEWEKTTPVCTYCSTIRQRSFFLKFTTTGCARAEISIYGMVTGPPAAGRFDVLRAGVFYIPSKGGGAGKNALMR